MRTRELGPVRAKAALALPGVVAVVTAEDLGSIGQHPRAPRATSPSVVDACLQPPLARDKVRYVGEPVAVVIAESRYLAEDALEPSRSTTSRWPVVADARRALETGAPRPPRGRSAAIVVDRLRDPRGRRARGAGRRAPIA